jgi:type IV fimbrial biogenesis protein FimT
MHKMRTSVAYCYGKMGLISSNKGMTLIELMVTLSIAAVILTLAVPSFQTLIRTSQVRTVTNGLVGVFNLARSEAIKRGWPVTVCKSSNINDASPSCNNVASWKDGWLAFVDKDQDGVVDADDTRLQVGRPDAPLTAIDGGTNYSNYLAYLPDGSSVGNGGGTNGSFTICLQGIQRVIDISNTGRVSVEAGTC